MRCPPPPSRLALLQSGRLTSGAELNESVPLNERLLRVCKGGPSIAHGQLSPTPSRARAALVREALEKGSTDNVTVMLVQLQ